MRPLKLLVLCKRFPQGRDLLERPYGRFYHLPRLLAASGHEVHIALLSYRRLPPRRVRFDGIDWSSDDLWPTGLAAYLLRQQRLAEIIQPDWVIGVSDTYFGIMAQRLAARCGARCAIDAYDNFESYIPSALPLHWLWRRALAKADLVTAAGPQLVELLRGHGASRCEILPMAADPAFRPTDRLRYRPELGLPTQRRLVGQIGAFDRRRGRDIVLRAVDRVRRADPAVSLVLSGRASAQFHAPPAIYGLGYCPDESMPALVGSLDVACVSLADNAFGRYSYPAKLCEAMACGIPVVASDTAPVRWMLGGRQRHLARLGDEEAMASAIQENLRSVLPDYGALPSWGESAAALEAMLR